MSDTQSTNCLNCGTALTGSYCQACGQSAKLKRISFKETINDFFSSTFALEGPLLFTLKSLAVNPGRMFREFIEGKRKIYYKPVAFFIVLTAIYLIVKALIDYDPLQGQTQPIDENTPPQVRKSMEAARYMVSHINHIMLILVFTTGLNLKLFFRKRYNLTEYLTVAFYTTGVYVIFGTLMMPIDKYVFGVTKTSMFIFLILYLVYASVSFFQSKSFFSVLKYLLAALLSVALYTMIGFGLSLLIVSMRG